MAIKFSMPRQSRNIRRAGHSLTQRPRENLQSLRLGGSWLANRKRWVAIALAAALCFASIGRVAAAADAYLVERGRPRAEIIIAPGATRTQRLAAVELQTYIEKISGARLTIVTEPSGTMPVRVFVGRSEGTERLGITEKGLRYGAYRIVSGSDWLVLIGDDTEFTPIEPWPRGYADIRSGRMQAAWDAITGAHWGYPLSQLHKHYSGPKSLFGTAKEEKISPEGHVHVWTFDERGSFNAVCGFLRSLGVRWYMPGPVGEIVPHLDSIPLPREPGAEGERPAGAARTAGAQQPVYLYDKTVTPDFPMRILNFRPAVDGYDVMMWSFRLGLRHPYGRQAAHGLRTMTDNQWTLKHHPDWFALYGGKRQNDPAIKNNQLCYSNEQLLHEAVRFAQAQFDHYGMNVVSIMPPDGFTAICQCERCRGRESPELGERGRLSNYVWGFVNRVAKQVGKSHPDKKISCCAYGPYTEPPSNMDKLEPNVQVIIVGGRRPLSDDRADLRRLRAAWLKKTDNAIEIFENYPFTGRGFYLPAYIPHRLGESINETKGQSRGEDVWLTMDFSDRAVGYNHFLVYFTARMYWGGPQQDPGKLFEEYVNKFYGPAAPEMKMFFGYCEEHWREMETHREAALRALDLLAAAKAKADALAGTNPVYARRIQLIDNYLDGLRSKAKQLAQKRGPVPSLRLVSGVEQRGRIVVDGRLDDGPWVKIPSASVGRLRELQTGRLPTFGTRFMAEWIGNDLYFAIRCDESVDEGAASNAEAQHRPHLNIATDKDGDPAIWYGDAVEILLATDAHSYYQIVVNPAGALVDLDRGAPRGHWFDWSSQAEVAVQVGPDHWTAEIRIPVTRDANDPLHRVVGRKPTASLPWLINVCRQRIRDNGAEYSAFSPTGTSSFHVPMKFGYFYAGRSQKFPADPTVDDYIISTGGAQQLERARKWNDALAAYLQLAGAAEATDFQKSVALQRAAHCAMKLKDYALAEDIARRIPMDVVAKTVRMEILAAQREWTTLLRQFGGENITHWPFWQISAAAFVRGQACYFLHDGQRADADLQLALRYEPDRRRRVSIRTLMAQNRELNLHDRAGALVLYLANLEGKDRIGAADEFRSLQRAAAILAGDRRFAEALAVFEKVDLEKLTGYWLHEMLLARADTLVAAGRAQEARDLYRRVLGDGTASQAQRKRARDALAAP